MQRPAAEAAAITDVLPATLRVQIVRILKRTGERRAKWYPTATILSGVWTPVYEALCDQYRRNYLLERDELRTLPPGHAVWRWIENAMVPMALDAIEVSLRYFGQGPSPFGNLVPVFDNPPPLRIPEDARTPDHGRT